MKYIYHLNQEDYKEGSNEIIQLGSYYGQSLFWRLVKETDTNSTYISDVIDVYKDFNVSKMNSCFTDNEKKLIIKDSMDNYVRLPNYEEILDLFVENEKRYLGYPTEYAISKGVTINTKDMLLSEIAVSNNECDGYYSENDVQELLLEEGSAFWYVHENKFVDLTGYICELELVEFYLIGVRVILKIKK